MSRTIEEILTVPAKEEIVAAFEKGFAIFGSDLDKTKEFKDTNNRAEKVWNHLTRLRLSA